MGGLQRLVEELGEQVRRARAQVASSAANAEMHRKVGEALAK